MKVGTLIQDLVTKDSYEYGLVIRVTYKMYDVLWTDLNTHNVIINGSWQAPRFNIVTEIFCEEMENV